jgi:hypothetical protein
MYMVDTWYGTRLVVGMVLMYMVDGRGIWYRLWCMVDVQFGTCVGAWFIYGLVQVVVHD